VYIDHNRFVERVEDWLFWCSASAGSGTGIARGVWWTNNEAITTQTGAIPSPGLTGADTQYAYVQNNTFKSTRYVNDASITLTGTVNGSSGKSGNTYQGLIADPSWYPPGDPATIDWTP
jgi:hypothetical protein